MIQYVRIAPVGLELVEVSIWGSVCNGARRDIFLGASERGSLGRRDDMQGSRVASLELGGVGVLRGVGRDGEDGRGSPKTDYNILLVY